MENFNRQQFIEMVKQNETRLDLLDRLLESMTKPPICGKEEAWNIIGGHARAACMRAYNNSNNFTEFCYEMFKEQGMNPSDEFYEGLYQMCEMQ